MPKNPAMYGSAVKMPTRIQPMCRSVARYVGNHVRKKTNVE
jgi:hypothetical protein